MAKPIGNCIHLVRTISDRGTRLDVEPTVKRITVDGTKYTRTTNCWIEYADKKIGTIYMADLPASVFMEKVEHG